jgi:hypothetical protein
MKKNILSFAILASSFYLSSCNNQSPEQANDNNPLVGNWTIDSISSTDSNSIGLLLFAMSFDSAGKNPYDIQITKDSITLYQKDTTSIRSYQLIENKNEILIPEDSSKMNYRKLPDGRMVMVSEDSTSLFLKKVN